MSKKTAQNGVIPLPLLIGGGAVVLIVVLVASGAMKFNFKVTKTGENGQKESVVEVETPTKPESAPTPQPVVKLAAEAYVNSNFTFSYPDGWKVQEAKNMVTFSRKSPDGGILIVTNPLGSLAGAKLATIADANKLVAKQQFKNVSFLKEEEAKLNGQNAWRYELTANNDGTDIKVIYYVLADSKNMYILMGTATIENWAELESSLTSSLNTFRLSE